MTLQMRLVAAVILFSMGSVARTLAEDKTPMIEVTGTAEVLVVPDEVVIRVGVETLDMSLAKSKKDNDERVKKIISITKGFEIVAEDIQTDNLRILLENAREGDKKVFKGYNVSTSIAIILRDVKKYDEVISGVLEAGANNLYGVEFRTSQLRKHRDEARRLALIAASEKAQAMAAVLHQSIGKPLLIEDDKNAKNYWGGLLQNNRVDYDEGVAAGFEGSTISLGRIKITADVRVQFELRETK